MQTFATSIHGAMFLRFINSANLFFARDWQLFTMKHLVCVWGGEGEGKVAGEDRDRGCVLYNGQTDTLTDVN